VFSFQLNENGVANIENIKQSMPITDFLAFLCHHRNQCLVDLENSNKVSISKQFSDFFMT